MVLQNHYFVTKKKKKTKTYKDLSNLHGFQPKSFKKSVKKRVQGFYGRTVMMS